MNLRDPGKTYVIRDGNDEDIKHLIQHNNYSPEGVKKVTQNKGWIIQYHSATYYVTPEFAKHTVPSTYLLFNIDRDYNYEGVAYPGSDISQVIDKWALKTSLNPTTAKTFEELIDEL